MNILATKFGKGIFFLALVSWFLGAADKSSAQQIRWLAISDLQYPVNSIGANYEGEFSFNQNGGNFFTWPAQFGVGLNDQNTVRMEGVWIGVKNFNDPGAGKNVSPKVIGSGPRNDPDRTNQIFPLEFKCIGKYRAPAVTVDGQDASFETAYDVVDSYDPNMAPDRVVIVKFNTSMGITVTRKVMAFASSKDGNYFINDWTFKNTGIYNAKGDVKQQTLDSTWFYFVYRYAFAGEGNGAASEIIGGNQTQSLWASFPSEWGISSLYHDFGDYTAGTKAYDDPASRFYHLRGFYAYYGPDNNRAVSYDEDWGCPAQSWDGRMSSWKFAGNVTLHADTSPADTSDDIRQPRTTYPIASDASIMQAVNQYDIPSMTLRWNSMTQGHPPYPYDSIVVVDVGGSTPYAGQEPNSAYNQGGGASQGQGYGPYTLAHGDSIHIVYAQACAGMSREKNLEVGSNWVQYYKGTATPDLVMPNGSEAPKTLEGANSYKKAWVFTGVDSLLRAYRSALENYHSAYAHPKAPPAPQTFAVTSEGDRINLQWSKEAESAPHFGGYVIYRSEGSSMNPLSRYEKIFECGKNNLPTGNSSGMRSWDDAKAQRGFDYYYYLQAKDDGTQATDPLTGRQETLYSTLEWTITMLPASLQRPAIPPGSIPFTFSTMKWVAMNNRGAWFPGTSYGKNDSLNSTDWVTYNGSDYVYVYADSLVAADSTNPSTASNVWRKATSKGSWASGTGYDPYDYVTHDGTTYYTPYQISGGQGLSLVRVVPNPYDIRSRIYQYGTASGEADKINFYGLPSPCTLKIYTERGDLIYTINHTRETGDETWYCETSYGQIVASGIYILMVQKPDGEKVFRKFVIIR